MAAENYTDSELQAFKIMGIVQLIVYLGLLIFAIYNTFYFLYRQKRYTIYFITVFYVLTYLVTVFRLALALQQIIIFYDYEKYKD